jgi:hypothetical protein
MERAFTAGRGQYGLANLPPRARYQVPHIFRVLATHEMPGPPCPVRKPNMLAVCEGL